MKKIILTILAFCSISTVFAIQNTENLSILGLEQSGGIDHSQPYNGVIDKIYVNALPNQTVVVELESGNFLDCGSGKVDLDTDKDGRLEIGLSCGVAITETIAIPATNRSARAVVHF